METRPSGLARPRGPCFNEAILFRGWKPSRGGGFAGSVPASMRPSSFEDGNLLLGLHRGPHRRASMRPSSFEDGNLRRLRRPICTIERFNEAILFRGWKPNAHGGLEDAPRFASMRPSSFEDGNGLLMMTRSPCPRRFNEAILFRGWKQEEITGTPRIVGSFNEAILFRGWKQLRVEYVCHWLQPASMRPSSFEDGNPLPYVPLGAPGGRFNEAILFRGWKLYISTGTASSADWLQ